MRLSLTALFCTIVLTASNGSVTLADEKAELEKELKKFQGTWTIESSVTGGMEIPTDQLKEFLVTFEGDKHTLKMGDKVIQVGTQKIDPSKSPKTIAVPLTDGSKKETIMLRIYAIDRDTLSARLHPAGKKRPTEFKSAPGSQNFVNVHKRVKK